VQSTGGIPVVDEIFTPEITERENLPLPAIALTSHRHRRIC